MKLIRSFFLVALFGFLSFPTSANATNVLLGAPVDMDDPNGDIGHHGYWTAGTLAEPSSITDGSPMTRTGQQWDVNTVYWASGSGTTISPLTLTINLAAPVNITSLALEADNNDRYQISYLDLSNVWHILGVIAPNTDSHWGLGHGYLSSFADTIVAAKLAITAISGDGYYSVSQIAAEGSIVPLPAALPLFGCALLGLAGWTRRKQTAN